MKQPLFILPSILATVPSPSLECYSFGNLLQYGFIFSQYFLSRLEPLGDSLSETMTDTIGVVVSSQGRRRLSAFSLHQYYAQYYTHVDRAFMQGNLQPSFIMLLPYCCLCSSVIRVRPPQPSRHRRGGVQVLRDSDMKHGLVDAANTWQLLLLVYVLRSPV